MDDLIWKTAGINLENWAGQNDKQISTLTQLMKMAANLMVFQKYFDQWDYSLKLIGEKMMQIVQNNWSAEKVEQMIEEQPTPHFYSKIFSKFHTVVEEGLLTATQKNLKAQQMLDINAQFGREVIPPSMIIKDMNIQGKAEIMEFLENQEKQMQAVQSEAQNIQHAYEEMKMKELMSKIHNQLSMARERDSRSESNFGLFEERMSMISKNHAMAANEKMDALTKLLEAIQRFGEMETMLKANDLETIKFDEEEEEKQERQSIERTEATKQFYEKIMQLKPPEGQQLPGRGQPQGQPQPNQRQAM